jgi:hypothetical protein
MLAKLAELDNPFANFVLTDAMPEAPDDGPAYVRPLFCASVSVRGLYAILRLVEPRRYLGAVACCLQEMKIGDPQAWT